eukprot:scaffold15414_cov114-Isochrysis_galbana.AAC.6
MSQHAGAREGFGAAHTVHLPAASPAAPSHVAPASAGQRCTGRRSMPESAVIDAAEWGLSFTQPRWPPPPPSASARIDQAAVPTVAATALRPHAQHCADKILSQPQHRILSAASSQE